MDNGALVCLKMRKVKPFNIRQAYFFMIHWNIGRVKLQYNIFKMLFAFNTNTCTVLAVPKVN